MIRKAISSFLNYSGFELRRKTQLERADDPYYVLSLLLNRKEITTIIDGGASIGDTSLILSDLFPDAEVYAFEPYDPFVEILKEKTKDRSRIRIESFALDEVEGSRTMIVNESEGTNSFFSANQSKNQPYGDLLRKKGEIEVTSKTLDQWAVDNQINVIDLIKLDLQGNELAALRGAISQLSSKNVKAILCEVSFIPQYENQPIASEVMTMINSYDFDLFNLYQMHYHHGQLIQADALFLHKSIYKKSIKATKALFLPHSRFLR
jgi:FkbM family methyltransferase